MASQVQEVTEYTLIGIRLRVPEGIHRYYKVKGEKDFDKAKAYAKDKFDELQNGRKDGFCIEDITSVNVFLCKREYVI